MVIMPFNILVGSNFFVNQKVDRSIIPIIQDKDIILVGNGNTLSTKSFRIHENLVEKLEASGAKKVIYTELTPRNMSILKRTDIIYIMGGDIRELLELYQNVLFKNLIEKHLKKGILIAEMEAAILLTDDISWYLNECCNLPDKDEKGLGLIQEKLYIHYKQNDLELEEFLEGIEEKYHIELKRMSDDDCYFTTNIVK